MRTSAKIDLLQAQVVEQRFPGIGDVFPLGQQVDDKLAAFLHRPHIPDVINAHQDQHYAGDAVQYAAHGLVKEKHARPGIGKFQDYLCFPTQPAYDSLTSH